MTEPLAGWPAPAVPGLLGLLGLVAGAASNALVERLPRRLERDWWREIAAQLVDAPGWRRMLGSAPPAGSEETARAIERALAAAPVTTAAPASTARRLAVAAVTGALFAAAGWRFGATPAAFAWCAALATLVTLALVDLDTRLLPDGLTAPLLWGGLLAATLHWTIAPQAALWGAVGGYLVFWIPNVPFRWATGREGMAPGDFKLLAALGAWLGWQAILPVTLIACLLGALAGVALRLGGRRPEGEPIPFGPFLAAAGVLTMLVGTAPVLRWIGVD